MAAYCRVYDSRHLQAGCQEPGSAPNPTLGNRVYAVFLAANRHSHSFISAKLLFIYNENRTKVHNIVRAISVYFYFRN